MYSLTCKDMGAPECAFVATDESAEGAVKKMAEHAAAEHADKMAEMKAKMSEAEMTDMMMKAVKQA